MATIKFEVQTYRVRIGFELSGGGGGPKSRGHVVCYGGDGHRFAIYFAAPGSTLAPPRYFPETKFGSINVPVDEMHNYIDLLRNEKPVYAYLNSDKPQWNNLSTSKEPIGEEES